jgi:hypothetical protein
VARPREGDGWGEDFGGLVSVHIWTWLVVTVNLSTYGVTISARSTLPGALELMSTQLNTVRSLLPGKRLCPAPSQSDGGHSVCMRVRRLYTHCLL